MKKTLLLLFLTGYTLASNAQTLRQAIQTIRVKNADLCTTKNGYWYQDKCWLHFDENMYKSKNIDLDSVVTAHSDFIKNAHITINDKDFPIESFKPGKDNLYFKFSFVFTDDESQKILQQRVRKTLIKIRKQFMSEINITPQKTIAEADSVIPKPTAMGRVQGKYNDFNKKDFTFNGILRDLKQRGKTYNISFTLSDALWNAGTTSLELRGNKAFITGKIGVNTYKQLKNLVNNHPEVRTLVLKNITGSAAENLTEQIVEFIKGYGLNTKVLANSTLSLEGTKLFLAGRERIVTRGAKIGVNAWSNGSFTGKDLPKNHPAHPFKMSFYKDLLKDNAEAFYYFTLDTDLQNNLKWLSEEQLTKWNIATKIIDDVPVIINYPGIPEEIATLGYAFGNSKSSTVIINAQQNPEVYLYTESFKKLFTKEGGINPNDYFVVNVHQYQSLHPQSIQKNIITLEQAKEYNQKSTEILAKVVKYFKSQNKRVILIGMSYGGMNVLDLLVKYGNIADRIFLNGCRLNMEEKAVEALSNGKDVKFNNGTELTINDSKNNINANKSKLIAAYASNNYTELLKDMDLANCIYVYGKKDEIFGHASAAEKDFLMKKDVLVLSVDKNHKNTLEGFLKKGILMSSD